MAAHHDTEAPDQEGRLRMLLSISATPPLLTGKTMQQVLWRLNTIFGPTGYVSCAPMSRHTTAYSLFQKMSQPELTI